MGWHLRPLPRCFKCGRAATQRLYNEVNAPGLEYCDRHAPAALKEAQKRYGEAS